MKILIDIWKSSCDYFLPYYFFHSLFVPNSLVFFLVVTFSLLFRSSQNSFVHMQHSAVSLVNRLNEWMKQNVWKYENNMSKYLLLIYIFFFLFCILRCVIWMTFKLLLNEFLFITYFEQKGIWLFRNWRVVALKNHVGNVYYILKTISK